MDIRAEKTRLIQHIVNNCVEEAEFLPVARAINVAAPDHMLRRWKKRFFLTRTTPFPTQPKLINRFCVGADPEFTLMHAAVVKREGIVPNAYIHARTLGMSTCEPFGADMSGRQAEVRAHPSRFVLEVVASLVDTLRWMNEMYSVGNCYWNASAMLHTDGVGGHIHIGRKRPDLQEATTSLDTLTRVMIKEGICVDSAGALLRAKTNYGHYGDVRPQKHGYEYRTMPTWLTSPYTAYLTLTWAKLAVLHGLTISPADFKTNKGYTMLRNLLRMYASRDDDARIALSALNTFGMPKYVVADMKSYWGIPLRTGKFSMERHHFPTTIPPQSQTILDVFKYLVTGEALVPRTPVPNWPLFQLPFGVHKINTTARTCGLEDVGQGLLSHGVQVALLAGTMNNGITITTPKNISLSQVDIKRLAATLDYRLLVKFEDSAAMDPVMYIALPRNLAANYHPNALMINGLRELIGKRNLLPITTADKLNTYKAETFVKVKKNWDSIGTVCEVINGQTDR